MTYKELYDDIVHLGFELELDSELDFNIIEAINRACRTVNALRPREEVVSILHTPLYPSCFLPDLIVLRDEHVLPVTNTRTLWFQAAGKGRVRAISDGKPVADHTWECKSGFADIHIGLGDADTLVFSPESAACVRNVCLYEKAYEEANSPWYAEEKSYNLSTLTDEAFDVIVGQPMIDGKPIVNYELIGKTLRLAADPSGVVTIRYRAKFPKITGNDPSESIPLDADLAPLIAPLAASWLYLEHDEDKAIYYRQRYEEMAARVDRSYHRPIRYNDKLNWG